MAKYQVHTDCFAYTENGCNVLRQLYCKFSNCKFYKQHREGEYPKENENE